MSRDDKMSVDDMVLLAGYVKCGNCPTCGVGVNEAMNYCSKCGQALDWRGEILLAEDLDCREPEVDDRR